MMFTGKIVTDLGISAHGYVAWRVMQKEPKEKMVLFKIASMPSLHIMLSVYIRRLEDENERLANENCKLRLQLLIGNRIHASLGGGLRY
jgi:hypothetical protein